MSEINAFEAQKLFRRARRGAFTREMLSALTGSSNDLLVYEEVRRKLRIGGLIYRGVQPVPVDAIVGSVDRYNDFDRAFLPRQTFTEERWERVGRAHLDGVQLPPVHLYKIGDAYFVMDGNHRVSVARSAGLAFIDAEVYEARLRVPVSKEISASDLEIIGEQMVFIEETGIDKLRPDFTIEVTVPGGYYRLLEHINVHRYLQSKEWQREFSMEEAVTQWIDQVYMPVVNVIRENNILDEFPGRTEADLYLWLNEHIYFLSQDLNGDDLNWDEAAQEFAAHYSPNMLKRWWHWITEHMVQNNH